MEEVTAHLLYAIETILFESLVIEGHLRLSRDVERFPGIGPPPGEDNVESILLRRRLPSGVIRVFLPCVKGRSVKRQSKVGQRSICQKSAGQRLAKVG